MKSSAIAVPSEKPKKGKTKLVEKIEKVEKAIEKEKTDSSLMTPLQRAEAARQEVRKEYLNFQKSWFCFAKAIYNVYKTGKTDECYWKLVGYENFKDFCLEEVKNFEYENVVKLMKVIEDWGTAIESHIDKDPKNDLPSWVTCYILTCAKNKFSKSELPRIRKDVIEGKIFQKDVQNLIRKKIDEEDGIVDVTPKSKNKMEAIEDEVTDAEDDEVDDTVTSETDDIVDINNLSTDLLKAATDLVKDLPTLRKLIGGYEDVTPKVVELAEVLFKKLTKISDEFTDHVAKHSV